MECKESKRYFVPLHQSCDKQMRYMHFVRGDISHFWLTYEDADEISKRRFRKVKLQKWYRHTPDIGAHVYFKDGEILKRALVISHVEGGIELLDLDRGDISTVYVLDNVFYMDMKGSSIHALCVSCVFSGLESIDVRRVEEWNPFFDKIMRSCKIKVRFDKFKMPEGDLFPTYEVTIGASFNGVNNFVNVNEVLQKAVPSELNFNMVFGCDEFLTKLDVTRNNGQNYGRTVFDTFRVRNVSDSLSSRSGESNGEYHSENSFAARVADISNIVGNKGIPVGDDNSSACSDSWHTAYSTEYCYTCEDGSMNSDESLLSGSNSTKRRDSIKLEKLSQSNISEGTANYIDAIEHSDLGSQLNPEMNNPKRDSNPELDHSRKPDSNPELDYDQEPENYEDWELHFENWDPMEEHYTTEINDNMGAETALTGYCPKDDARICHLFERTGKCFKHDAGICSKEHVKMDPGVYTTDKHQIFTYKTILAPLEGSKIKVLITDVKHPFNFYARILDDVSNFDESDVYGCFELFENYINKPETYRKLKRFGILPAFGELVLLEWESRWYRAMLREEVTGNSGIFFFVDYGWKKEIRYLNIRRISEELAYFESRLFNCAVHNLELDSVRNLGSRDCKFLKNQLNKICVACVKDVSDEGRKIFVTLEACNGQDIGEQLGKSGFWKLRKEKIPSFQGNTSRFSGRMIVPG